MNTINAQTTKGYDWEETCLNGRCTRTVYPATRYTKDSAGVFRNITDVVTMDVGTNFILNVRDLTNNNTINLRTIVVINDTTYNYVNIPKSVKHQLNVNSTLKNKKHSWKWALNFSGVNGLEYIGWDIGNPITYFGNNRIERHSYGDTTTIVDFSDLVDSAFTVNISQYINPEDELITRVLIGNLTGKDYLDPTTTIKANDTDSRAWAGEHGTWPPTSRDFFSGDDYSSADYLAIGASDDSDVSSGGSGTADEYHAFNMTVPSYTTLNWIYILGEVADSGGATDGLTMYVWDTSSSSWSEKNNTSPSSLDRDFTYNISSSPTNYINTSESNTIYWTIQNNDTATTGYLRADYAYIQVSYIYNVAPTFSNNKTSLPNGTTYNPNNNYGFEINWTDTDSNFDNATFWTDLNITGGQNFTADNDTSDIFYINFTDIGAGTYYYKWYGIDTSGSENATDNMTYYIDKNSTGVITSFSLNDTYINFNETIRINVTAPIHETLTLELQSSGNSTNYTATYQDNNNYTFDIDSSHLGDSSSNATRVNITNLYFGGNNYTSSSNTTSLNFSYATADISVSHPSSVPSDSSITFTVKYNTTENTYITKNCSIVTGATTYYLDYSSGSHTKEISTDGWSPHDYDYTITCSNNSYETKTATGSFEVTGSIGGGTPGAGGGGGGPLYPKLEIVAHLGEFCDNETPCAEGLICENSICVQPELEFCGNGVCDFGETFLNCPEDCPTQTATVAKAQFIIIAGSLGYVLIMKPRIEKKRKRKSRRY